MIQKTFFICIFVLGIGLFVHSELEKQSHHIPSVFDFKKKEIEKSTNLQKTQEVFSYFIGTSSHESKELLSKEEAQTRWKTIQGLNHCWKNLDCGMQFPNSYASERSFYIRDLILEEIGEYLGKSIKGEEQIAQSTRAVELLLTLPDDQIRASALDLAAKLPADAKIVDVIAKEIIPELIDTELTQKVALEFERQLQAKTGKEEIILHSIEEVILHGGNFASKEMARLAPSLLSERDRPLLQKWLAALPKNSERFHLLAQK
jgi:hypothetical protein